MTTEVWRKEMENWLGGFAWIWFCSLTFRPGLTAHQARWRLHKWLDELKECLGNGNFGYFAVREFGRTGQDLHYHVLVMGLRASHAAQRLEWMRRWYKLAGDALIGNFNPGSGGLAYILKDATQNDPDGIEFDLSSETRLQTELEQK